MVPEQTIGASYGDALFAAIGTGLVPADTDWAREGEVIEPDSATRARYDELYGVYNDLYPTTQDSVHTLARIQESAFHD